MSAQIISGHGRKTRRLHVRIDDGMGDKLQAAADDLGLSAASLVRACVRDMLRNGGTFFMLPENLRLPIIEEEERRTKTQAFFREEMQRRRSRQSNEYMRSHRLPKRSF